MARGMLRAFKRVSSQSRRRMSKSMVREALVTSVTWTAPPVSFQRSQVSTVPKRISPRSAFSWAPSTWSRSHRILVAEK